jgi:diguanylate cyclase (GGDEF)-like protein
VQSDPSREPDESGRAQIASEQIATEWERSHTPGATLDVLALEESRVADATALERGFTAADRSRDTARRLATAARRDKLARVRDLAAAARDRVAEARDEAAHARDRSLEAAEEHVTSDASARHLAALERVAARTDREAAAADRDAAAADRRQAGVDELTHVYRRGTGELALAHEIDRARRSGRSLVVAIIDVDALKAVNDSEGHPAGDALLRDVAIAITETMRSYDITVRWGGDEFVCGLSDVTAEVAAVRVIEVERALEARHPGASVTAGLAQLRDDDTLESLIARADAALYSGKSSNGAA